MFSEAIPPARKHRQFGWFRVIACVAMLAGITALNACSGVSSAPSNSQQSQGNLTLSGAMPAASVGVSYRATVAASGGTAPYTFKVASGQLPTGLTLGQTTGTISGTPSASGIFKFDILATDSTGLTGAQPFQITVSSSGGVVVTVSPATATVVSGGTKQFSALVSNTSNTAVTWSASPGTISTSGLYQAPTVSMNTSATVTATSQADPTKSGKASVSVTAPGALSISTLGLPAATAGTAYSTMINASGGKTPYTWTVSSGSMPGGFSLSSGGSVSGTTTQTGGFTFTVQVKDSSSPQQTATRSFTLTVSSSSGGGNTPQAAFFGFSQSDTNGTHWPTVTYGMQRYWDSPPNQWPSLNTASGVFTWSSLDANLALAYANGAMDIMYTLARTPPWATSNPTDTTCHYTTTSAGGGNGECDPPIDLNSDGSGTNAIWKAWITAIATHANDPTYLLTHAHIKYWEIWNEPDNKPYWAGSIAQLARLTEDANCIITGRGVIHENGNGTATPCTATPIDASAQIVMASAHAKGVALVYGQNELYCNASPSGYQLPCPNPPDAIASAVDIINFHMKPGNESGNNCPSPTPCTAESAMQWYVSNIHSILQAAELAKPLWNGEAQYSETGFTGAYADADMAASFMSRFYLSSWSLGFTGIAWYTASGDPAAANTSYQQTYNWLVDALSVSPCAASGTVWSCEISKSGTNYLIMWDTSQTCSSGTCTTSNQSVASQWTQYQDMTTASTPVAISGHSVPVGIKPVVIQ